MPLSPNIVNGVAAYTVAIVKRRFALYLLLVFVGPLGTGEVIDLELKDLPILIPSLVVIALANTKVPTRSGNPEKVLIKDPFLTQCVGKVLQVYVPESLC